MTDTDVLIIGGGVAGLAAAVELSAKGTRVRIIDRRQHLGGRTYSFRDEATGDIVDNGQHILMGCYHETVSYLTAIGSRHLATLQPSLRIPFADVRGGKRSTLRAAYLPAPLHVLAGLMMFSPLSPRDRLRLMKVGTELLWSAPWKEYALSEMTVEHWLESLGQSENVRRYLWDVIAIGSLNEMPGTVSALPFFKVLRAAFFGKRTNASLLIPNTGLSELLVEPARRFVEQRGGSVMLGAAADSLDVKHHRVEGVTLSSGETVRARSVILAVPHYAAVDLLPDKEAVQRIEALETSPIVTINLWFDRPVMSEPFCALLNGHVQWAFNRSALVASSYKGQYISCVISGARFHIEKEKHDLVMQALDDLKAVFPKAHEAVLLNTLVIKEVRATFLARPGTEAMRPGTTTAIEGLYLAGDWTDTGLPATIEGAIKSGRTAAKASSAYLAREPSPLRELPPLKRSVVYDAE